MRVEVLTGIERRRKWNDDQKRAIVAAAFAPGAKVADVARHADINSGQIYRWRKDFRSVPASGFAEIVVASDTSVPVQTTCDPVIDVETGLLRVRIWASAPPDLAAAIVQALNGGRG